MALGSRLRFKIPTRARRQVGEATTSRRPEVRALDRTRRRDHGRDDDASCARRQGKRRPLRGGPRRDAVEGRGRTRQAPQGHQVGRRVRGRAGAASRRLRPETLNDYEREREVRRSPLSHRETRRSPTRARRSPPLWPRPSQERIARNKLVLQGLKLKETARALESTVASAAAANADAAASSRPRERKPKAPPPPPRPKSTRATRARPSRRSPGRARRPRPGAALARRPRRPRTREPPHVRRVVRARGYHPRAEDDGSLRGMGIGRGAGRHGARRLPAAEAWEQNGGGRFERKPAKGESAKEFARRMMKKNPNAYFYRHNPPGEDAWHGDWSEDETATLWTWRRRTDAGISGASSPVTCRTGSGTSAAPCTAK